MTETQTAYLANAKKNLPEKRRRYTAADHRLVLAWLKGEIGIAQVGASVGLKRSGVVAYIAYCTRDAVKKGKITG